jgi:sugar/nucleoside kinase (ribokinase family)
MSLISVGSVAYDSVETRHGKRDDMLGGSATYFSLAASLFTKPGLVGVVGDDFRGSDVALLESHMIDLAGLERTAGKTFRWGGVYHSDMNGRTTLFTHLNVFEAFQPKLPQSYRDADFLFLGNIHPSLQWSVLEQVTKPRFVAIDTMNLWIDTTRDELLRVLSRVDAIFVNDEEARQLTGEYTMPRVARAIQAMGPQIVVIKRGEHGAIMFDRDDTFFAPAYPLEEVIDPTGAGDSFAGGFVGYLAHTGDFSSANLRRAAVAGTLVASFCVEGFSVERLRKVDHAMIRDRYRSFVDLTASDALLI